MGIKLVCMVCRKHEKLYLVPTKKDGYFCEECLNKYLEQSKGLLIEEENNDK